MNIKSYIIGDNNDDLFGCHNDAKLIYNLFYTFYLQNNSIWDLPNIYIKEIFNKINIDDNNIIIIYFSGHSNKKGELLIKKKKYSSDYFLNLININKKKCKVIFIIDSCYSINFISKNNYEYIFKIHYFLSQSPDNVSKEFLIDYDNTKYKYIKIKNNYSKIVNGIFTYFFCKIIDYIFFLNLDDIHNIDSVIKNPIWKYVLNKFNQNIF